MRKCACNGKKEVHYLYKKPRCEAVGRDKSMNIPQLIELPQFLDDRGNLSFMKI